MQEKNSFTIYNASAGSGKTFTLVKEYLKILFTSNRHDKFKNILAITFTNKAVAEMKQRIIESLKQFSDASIIDAPNSMFLDICNELQMAPKALQAKSEKILKSIMHNYAAFDISTIDGFTHKLIRTFAYDLKLPLNFEVELDQEALLIEAVDSLIAKAGSDTKLTKVLVDFAIEKADDDKSWDVSFDFNKIAKLLVNENDMPFIETLKDKSLDDFKELKTSLKNDIKASELKIIEKANSVLRLIENKGLEYHDFSRSTLPNHFKKASKLDLATLYENKLQENISERKSIYTKTLNPHKAGLIDAILPEIEIVYHDIKNTVYHYKFLKTFYKNITPLSVLNAIGKELKNIKKEQNKMLISEFNTIIGKEIRNQPTPFIYERIGEKFNHYFIDEFQDTSVMQWENLIPLLDNSLSTETGTAMLVGDAKQAIYRWRGGKAEQFIDLYNKKKSPFQVEQKVDILPTNYRSFKEIIDFNNHFFKYLSNNSFIKKDYEQLYENAHQKTHLENGGYVNFTFLEIGKEEDQNELYAQKVIETIDNCLENGFKLEDICILVRKKKEGVSIANFLSQHKIPIVSSETLLVSNSPEVEFINNILTLLVQPKNNEIKVAILNYLAITFSVENKHAFFSKHIHLDLSELFKSFEKLNITIDANRLLQIPLYDLAETIVRSFSLVKTSNAYIQFYLDVVLDFSLKKGSDISGFIDYFDKKKEHLSIVSPKGQNAVQIMTIHKSKGLEFPIVIFPYADLDIYTEKEPKEWYALDKEKYSGFSHALLNYGKDFENYGAEGLRIYENHQAELELDNINLLYVALTRPIEQLYIISKKEGSEKAEITLKKYSGLFINYLKQAGLWNHSQQSYSFGTDKKSSLHLDIESPSEEQKEFISTAKEDHHIKIVTNSGYLWDSSQQEAIEKGNLIHHIMSGIKTVDDVDFIINDSITASIINEEQAPFLKGIVMQIMDHPELKDCFNPAYTIYNERDIISQTGAILRPDRIVINNKKEAIIIDYKTGLEDKKHIQQIESYQYVLEDMELKIIKKILVYVNNGVQVKNLSL